MSTENTFREALERIAAAGCDRINDGKRKACAEAGMMGRCHPCVADRALAAPSPETGTAGTGDELVIAKKAQRLIADVAVQEIAKARVLLGRFMVWASSVAFKSLYGEQVIADTDAFLAAPATPAAEPVKPPATCRRCSECPPPSEHHWMDNFDAEGEGDPTHECKHCDALGDECETCGGEGGRTSDDGYDMGLCPPCKGDGVRARTPAAGAAPKGER